jgi:hypothetical protein
VASYRLNPKSVPTRADRLNTDIAGHAANPHLGQAPVRSDAPVSRVAAAGVRITGADGQSSGINLGGQAGQIMGNYCTLSTGTRTREAANQRDLPIIESGVTARFSAAMLA